MTPAFKIRRAAAPDAGIVAQHRAGMFRDMGVIASAEMPELLGPAGKRLEELLARGEYLAWLASPSGEPGKIVAGAGVLIRTGIPYPNRDGGIASGRQALVMNVFTEPEYRRRGAARLLMLEVLAWAKDARIESLVLHAAPDGKPLYESLGFVPTNEMRYDGNLAHWERPVT